MLDPSVKKHTKADGLTGACDKLKMNPLSKNLVNFPLEKSCMFEAQFEMQHILDPRTWYTFHLKRALSCP
jgi:hypothetical protein